MKIERKIDLKKAIAALLASFVGLFGYQIVDKALESRVDNLEYQVSSQQEEIESLHNIGKYSISYSSSTDSSENSSDSTSSTIEPSFDYSRTFVTPSNIETSNVEPHTVYPGHPEYKKVMMRAHYDLDSDKLYANAIEENGTVSDNDYPLYYSYDDPLCVASEEVTRTYYDDEYSVTSGYDYSYDVVTYHVKGYTDKIFAGCVLCFDGSQISNGGVINEDGTFEFDYTKVIFFNKNPWFIYGGYGSYELNTPRIHS